MKIRKALALGLLFLPAFVTAQQGKDSVLKFSLTEAQNYALQNSPVIKNATIDLESAKKKIWETTTMGLPQVNGKLAYTDMITLPSIFTEIFSALNSPKFTSLLSSPDVENLIGSNFTIPSINDLKWNATLDITVSQLIFSGAWIIGLQTSKAFKGLSELAVTKSQIDLKEAVTNAYFLVLILQGNKALLDTTYVNTTQILAQIDAMNKQGLNEETDVDQLQLTTSTIKNAKESLDKQLESARNLLCFQMGLNISQPIALTDDLKGLSSNLANEGLLLKDFQVENIVDYQLMASQEKLAFMNYRYNQASVLPDIAGFYQHDDYYNKKNIMYMTPPDMFGISMNIPIFASGQRYERIGQAHLAYLKAKNSTQQASEALKMGYADAKSAYINSLNKYNNNKDNIKLSEKIFQHTLIKYNQGSASSLELTQAQNQYLQNQTNYFMSIFDLISSKCKLEKYVNEK